MNTTHTKKLLSTEWKLPTNVIDSSLSEHYILYWSAEYLIQQLEEEGNAGILYRDGRIFTVQYYKCTEADCIALPSAAQVALSFRIPKHTIANARPVVLVSCNTNAIHNLKK